MAEPCGTCGGEGTVIVGGGKDAKEKPCPSCHGKGTK